MANEEPHSQKAPNVSQPRHKNGLSFFRNISKQTHPLESTHCSSIDGDQTPKKNGLFRTRDANGSLKEEEGNLPLCEPGTSLPFCERETSLSLHGQKEILPLDEQNVCEMVAVFKDDGYIGKFVIKPPEEHIMETDRSLGSEYGFNSLLSEVNSVASARGKRGCNKCPACIERMHSKNTKSSMEGMNNVDVSRAIRMYEARTSKGTTPNESRRSSIARYVTVPEPAKRSADSPKGGRVIMSSNDDEASSTYLSLDDAGSLVVSPLASIAHYSSPGSGAANPSPKNGIDETLARVLLDDILSNATKTEDALANEVSNSDHTELEGKTPESRRVQGNIISRLGSHLSAFSESMHNKIDAHLHGYLGKSPDGRMDGGARTPLSGTLKSDGPNVVRNVPREAKDDESMALLDDLSKTLRDDLSRILREDVSKALRDDVCKVVKEDIAKVLKEAIDAMSEKVLNDFERRLSNDSKGQFDSLNSKFGDLSVNVDTINSKLELTKKANVEVYEKMLNCRNMASNVESFKAKLDECNVKVDECSLKANECTTKLEECAVKVKECKGTVGDFRGDVDYCKGAMVDCRRRLDECRDKVEQVKEVNIGKMGALKEVSAVLDAIKEKTTSINICINNINGTVRSQLGESTKFSSQLQEFKTKMADVEAIQDSLLSSLKLLSGNVDSLSGGAPSGRGDIKRVDEKISALSNDVGKLANTLRYITGMNTHHYGMAEDLTTKDGSGSLESGHAFDDNALSGHMPTGAENVPSHREAEHEEAERRSHVTDQWESSPVVQSYTPYPVDQVYTIEEPTTYSTLQEPVYTTIPYSTPLVEAVPSGNAMSEQSALYPFLLHTPEAETFATPGQDQTLHTQVSFIPFNGTMIKHTKQHVTLPEIAQEYLITSQTPVALQLANQVHTIQ